jgi:hypothetical protein
MLSLMQYVHLLRSADFKQIKGLLAIQLVDDVDMDVLEELIAKSVKWMRNKYGK